jgi:hypothetical protein
MCEADERPAPQELLDPCRYAGDRTPDLIQRLLERASWNTLAAMAAVRDFVVEHLADDGLSVLVSTRAANSTAIRRSLRL